MTRGRRTVARAAAAGRPAWVGSGGRACCQSCRTHDGPTNERHQDNNNPLPHPPEQDITAPPIRARTHLITMIAGTHYHSRPPWPARLCPLPRLAARRQTDRPILSQAGGLTVNNPTNNCALNTSSLSVCLSAITTSSNDTQ